VRGEVVSVTLLGLDGIVGIGGIALGLALPESALLGVVLGVVVGLGLLAAAVPDESQLSKDGEEEEDESNDGNGKASLVETARSLQGRKMNAAGGVLERHLVTGIRVSTAQRGVDIAAARAASVTGGICEIDKGSQEGQVE